MSDLNRTEQSEADRLVGGLRSGDPRAERAAEQALSRWAAGHAHRENYVREMANASALLDAAAPELRLRYPREARMVMRRWPPTWMVNTAVACTFIIGIASVIWWMNPVLERRMIATGFGEQRSVVLGDGTKILLNTASKLSTMLRVRTREAVLDQGEAQFEVAKDARRPWLTHAGLASVEVLGTVFSVRREGDGANVVLYEGSVAFRPGPDAQLVMLKAGQAVRAAGGVIVQSPHATNLAVAGAWREQRMVFEDTLLSDAVAEARRYRRAPIVLDPAVTRLRITGAFPTTDPERLLRLLPEALPVEVHHWSDGTAEILPRAAKADAAPLERPQFPGR